MLNIDEKIDYKLIDKKVVYKGKRLTVEQVNYYNTRKKQNVYREHVIAGKAAIIIPITNNEEFIMIKEPRTPIGKNILAFPTGMIEENESPEEGALRELEEEIGYKANYIKRLRKYYPAVGYSNEEANIFLAKDLIKGNRHLDDTEDIEVVTVSIKDVKKMLDEGKICSSGELIALFHYFTYEYKERGV